MAIWRRLASKVFILLFVLAALVATALAAFLRSNQFKD